MDCDAGGGVLDDSLTRNFSRFDIRGPTFVRFERYLCSIDGGERYLKTARELSTDLCIMPVDHARILNGQCSHIETSLSVIGRNSSDHL